MIIIPVLRPWWAIISRNHRHMLQAILEGEVVFTDRKERQGHSVNPSPVWFESLFFKFWTILFRLYLDYKLFSDMNPRQHAGLIPESHIWAYIVQLSSVLRTIHAAGLACRTLDPTKILITAKSRFVGVSSIITSANKKSPWYCRYFKMATAFPYKNEMLKLIIAWQTSPIAIIFVSNNMSMAMPIFWKKELKWFIIPSNALICWLLVFKVTDKLLWNIWYFGLRP